MPFDRKRACAVLAVLAALSVVALASTAGIDGGRARTVDVEPVVDGAVVVIAAYAAVMGTVAVVLLAGGPRRGRRPRRPMWPTLVGYAVLAALLWLVGPFERGSDEEPSADPTALGDGGGADEAVGEPAPDDTGTGLGIAAAGLVVLAIAGAALVVAARRRAPVELPGVEVEPASPAERDDAVARARACTDPREAVLLAMVAAEALLSQEASTRRPRSTSAREWAAVLRLPPLDDLVGRYEIARFSHHDVSDHDRTVALDALEALV